jgi:hypothetical protein
VRAVDHAYTTVRQGKNYCACQFPGWIKNQNKTKNNIKGKPKTIKNQKPKNNKK